MYRWAVYPRVGGGNSEIVMRVVSASGLSPRGRGKPAERASRALTPRSIPAWAGETAHAAIERAIAEVYPRVGGGNASGGRATFHDGGLSPRGRGKQYLTKAFPAFIRSIPAWAGETICTFNN